MVDPVTWTYNFTGGWQKFNVPGPVGIVKVEVYGAGSSGVQGGRLIGKLRVKGADDLYLLVGEHGHTPSSQNGGNQTTGGGGPGGAGGKPSRLGGSSGGGASEIRLNGTGGELLCISGGAGGASGDGGLGGPGGGNAGGDGHRASGPDTNRATGGNQNKGGNGGTSASGDFNGEDAGDAVSGRGGAGGHSSNDKCVGGGGGGGGYHAGGGGQAAKVGVFAGGGGGGGSSWNGKLFDVEADDKLGLTGDGQIKITFDPDGDPAPITPTDVKLNGEAESAEYVTRARSVEIQATVKDTVSGATWVTDNDVRMVVALSPIMDPGHPAQVITDIGKMVLAGNGVEATGGISKLTVGGLQANTLYHGRVYSQDNRSQFSNSYVSISFWTDRPPNAPALISPGPDTEFESDDTLVFSWLHTDPDTETGHPESQENYAFQYRLAATVLNNTPGPWVQIDGGSPSSISFPASNLTPGRWYEWRVATAVRGLWSPWSGVSNFYITAIALPPTLLGPINGEAIYAAEDNVFEWKFNTLLADELQTTVDLRYRAIGATDWTEIDGDLIEPGSGPRWLIPAETFVTGTNYEWQARVHTSNTTVSQWSGSATFWAVRLPTNVPDNIPIDVTRMQEALGQYDNRVYIYMRGGTQYVGEIRPVTDLSYDRKRDDIGTFLCHVTEWDPETREMLQSLKPWAHEIVVMRNGKRAFEGPIVRLSGNRTSLEIEAKDVMGYVYRRILRNGYNDSYQIVGGQQVGLHTVVYRAQRIITNALIYDDPNVLPYLTPIHNPGDAIQSRITKAFTKTAWEEVDELAAKAGLDYSIAGRRIILNDTHRAIGRLPELSDGDFSEAPIVTVYGMQFATDFGVTNNNGYWGLATRHDSTLSETGYIEQLASEYGESNPEGGGGEELTPGEIAALIQTLNAQAERNIASRYPMPVIVRVPDNSSLNPNVNLGINQLVPGVWAPLRSTQGLVQASQWQKLDSVTVKQDHNGESIQVVFSPAPNGGTDPDADLVEDA